jgi:hypothetical protein
MHTASNRNWLYANACHADAEDFNVNGYLTDFEEDYKTLEAALLAKGLINEDGATVAKNADGSPVILEAGPAQALFFYNLVHEDGSEGIHNPNYFNALMESCRASSDHPCSRPPAQWVPLVKREGLSQVFHLCGSIPTAIGRIVPAQARPPYHRR